MTWIIYCFINLENKKRYIGQTKQKLSQRWYKHRWVSLKGSTLPFHNSIRKYGKDKFASEILEENLNSIEMADEAEKKWISHFKSNDNQFGYNLDGGGHINKSSRSSETLNKMKEISSLRMQTSEMKNHMKIKMIEHFSNIENRKKSSETMLLFYKNNPSILEQISKNTSKSIKEKWKDPEYRAKQIAARKVKWQDPEYKKFMLDSRKNLKLKTKRK